MPHLSPTHHETSKHVSPHKTDSRELAKKVREEERDKWFEELGLWQSQSIYGGRRDYLGRKRGEQQRREQ
jgi:hypothetical protein